MRPDRSDIERQIHQAQQMMHHPHHGMPAAPHLLIADCRPFLRWTGAAIHHLQQPWPVPELEHGLTY